MHLWRKFLIVAEGAQVPNNFQVIGKPAFIYKIVTSNSERHISCLLDLFKVLRLGLELYLFFVIMLLRQFSWIFNIPSEWRYADILKFSIESVRTSLILKWTLIGKRRSGKMKDTLWGQFLDWSIDWHFKLQLVSCFL